MPPLITLSAPSLSPHEMSLSGDSKARSVTEQLVFLEADEEWAFLKLRQAWVNKDDIFVILYMHVFQIIYKLSRAVGPSSSKLALRIAQCQV